MICTQQMSLWTLGTVIKFNSLSQFMESIKHLKLCRLSNHKFQIQLSTIFTQDGVLSVGKRVGKETPEDPLKQTWWKKLQSKLCNLPLHCALPAGVSLGKFGCMQEDGRAGCSRTTQLCHQWDWLLQIISQCSV